MCKDREQKCAVMREWVCNNRGKAEVGLFTLVREQQEKIEKTPFGILLQENFTKRLD